MQLTPLPGAPAHRSGKRGRVSTGSVGWLLGLLGLVVAAAMLWTAAQALGRLEEPTLPGAGPTLGMPAPPLPDDGGPFRAGTARQAQHESRLVAEAFADCVHEAKSRLRLAVGAPPPYLSCVKARSFGLTPEEVGRRGRRGPIAGRGARNQLGVFTGHGGSEAYLLQYDGSGRGWGFAFSSSGQVEAMCRTVKGRACWNAEYERTGALFLGDSSTVTVLAAVLERGRGPG